jgi:hypothetical protein
METMEWTREGAQITVNGTGRFSAAATTRWRRLLAGVALATAIAAPAYAGSSGDVTTFQLFPNQKFVPCLAASEGVTPTVTAVVKRGRLNDRLKLYLRNFKSGLNFDLFTVERSSQLANGAPDPAFRGFGLAWYQSDIQVNTDDDYEGEPSKVEIKTILLDQIFGFDPDVGLAPTNTFHVGFWFNDPNDATPCGFDVTRPTPFNGDHRAGPLAFISRPVEATDLGPLCLNPDTSTVPATCNP